MSNILMQVETEKSLLQWISWFNTRADPTSNIDSSYYQNELLKTDPCLDLLETITDFNTKQSNEKSDTKESVETKRPSTNIRRLTRQVRLDSGITTHRLLGGDDEDYEDDSERRGSEMTIVTLDSCYSQPTVLVSEYGVDEINRVRSFQQQRHVQDNQTVPYSASMMLGSITDEEHRQSSHIQDNRVSFYSSFVGYVSNTGISSMTGTTNLNNAIIAVPSLTENGNNSSNDNNNDNSNNNNSNQKAGSSISLNKN